MEVLPSLEALHRLRLLFAVRGAGVKVHLWKADSEGLFQSEHQFCFLFSEEQTRTCRRVLGDPNVVRLGKSLDSLIVGLQVQRGSPMFPCVYSNAGEAAIAIEYANGGETGNAKPNWEVLLHVRRKLPPLLHESLLEDTGKGEVTRWPLDGDEARSVGDRYVAIRARVNRRRPARAPRG